MPAGKAFVLRSGCALLPHPWSPNHIIMHGGRSTADVQQPAAIAASSREKLVLSDWHLLTLSAPPSSASAIEVHAALLRTSSAVAQACLQTCKHCLVATTAAPHGKQLPVAVCGGSRGLSNPRPCTIVTVDISDRRVGLADSSRVGALQAIRPSLQHAQCGGAIDLRSGRVAAFLLPDGGPCREMLLSVAAITGGSIAEAWKGGLGLPPQEGAQPAWTALCVSSYAPRGQNNGSGRAVVVAQCMVDDKLAGVFAWFPAVSDGPGSGNGADRAKQTRKLLLSPVDATARVQQARREAEARCGPCGMHDARVVCPCMSMHVNARS